MHILWLFNWLETVLSQYFRFPRVTWVVIWKFFRFHDSFCVMILWQLGVINVKSELVDPDGLLKQLRILKSLNVDGVTVDCWWGIVEAHAPQEYNWNGYRRLFQMVHELKLKLQVRIFTWVIENVNDSFCITSSMGSCSLIGCELLWIFWDVDLLF